MINLTFIISILNICILSILISCDNKVPKVKSANSRIINDSSIKDSGENIDLVVSNPNFNNNSSSEISIIDDVQKKSNQDTPISAIDNNDHIPTSIGGNMSADLSDSKESIQHNEPLLREKRKDENSLLYEQKSNIIPQQQLQQNNLPQSINSKNNSYRQKTILKKNCNIITKKNETKNIERQNLNRENEQAISEDQTSEQQANALIVNKIRKYKKNELPNLGPLQYKFFEIMSFMFSEDDIISLNQDMAIDIYNNIDSMGSINIDTPQDAIDPTSIVNNILLPYESIHGNYDNEKISNLKRDIKRLSLSFDPSIILNGPETPIPNAYSGYLIRSANIYTKILEVKEDIKENPEYSDGKTQNLLNLYSQKVPEMYFTSALALNYRKKTDSFKVKLDIIRINNIMTEYFEDAKTQKTTIPQISPYAKFAIELNKFINQDLDMEKARRKILSEESNKIKRIKTLKKIRKCITPTTDTRTKISGIFKKITIQKNENKLPTI